ncbi:MAG: outer membrane lipid asymmetry maintenance protein MlaD [Deltaproteobacteria bacterium]|nr:outer membrane lipid asymmetry maintenance protein MlaD [Deltaproteobacteria bacterium]
MVVPKVRLKSTNVTPMKTFDSELLVGVLLLCGIAVLGYISFHLGQVSFGAAEGYTIQAEFTNAGGLQDGAAVELAGVQIGRVTKVQLNEDYHAHVRIHLQSTVVLKEDAKAAIKSAGLIGERYIDILPGTAANQIAPDGYIRHTESPVDIQEVIQKFIFGDVEAKPSSNDIQ